VFVTKKKSVLLLFDKHVLKCSYNVLDTFSVCFLVFLNVAKELLCDIEDKVLVL